MSEVDLLQKIYDTLQHIDTLLTNINTYVVFGVVIVLSLLLVYFTLLPLWQFCKRL